MGKATVVHDFSKWFGLRATSAHRWLLGALLLVLSTSGSAFAAEPAAGKNVLVLDSFTGRSLGTFEILKSGVRASARWPINFYVEYLEGRRLEDEAYEIHLVESLRHTYGEEKLDLVMAQSYPALQFAVRHRNQLFPGVPIVFLGVDSTRLPEHLWHGVTGVIELVDIRGTIALALRLHPDTKLIAVVTDNSEWDRYWLAAVHAELLHYQGKLAEIDLVALPPGRLLEKVASFPSQTVVLFQQFPKESVQLAMGTFDVLGWVGQRLPTYCIWPELCVNHGGIGGSSYLTFDQQSVLAGKLAGRVLSGERPDGIPPVHGDAQQAVVDWRQLRHWNILESALPPGSRVLYREATLWQRVQKYAVAAITVIVVQSLLIFGLLWQRARKRKAEAALRENERRFRGRLLEAQEEERRRIARELHDDISQKLALLSTELVEVNRSVNRSVAKKRLQEIQEHCLDIAHDVHSLSHQLHSSKLDYLGIVAAVRGLCNEVCKQCGVCIEFKHDNVPTRLPENVSVCLFRVAQEALHNAVKYSGMKQFEVEVRARSNEVELVVADAGAGFDVEEATTNRGLGLVSMQERLRLVRGRFSIESSPGSGTRIVAAAPLSGCNQGTSPNEGANPAVSVTGAA